MLAWRSSLLGFLLVLATILAAPHVAAQSGGGVQPQNQDFWVEADYKISMDTASNYTIDATLRVHQAKVDGQRYTADDIRNSYQGVPRYPGQKLRDDYRTALVDAVRAEFLQGLESSFPKAVLRRIDSAVILSNLEEADVDPSPYKATVDFRIQATLHRNRAVLGLGDFSDAAIASAFRSGASVVQELQLAADPGFNNLYAVTPPAGLEFRLVEANDKIDLLQGGGIRLKVDNEDGAAVRTARAPVVLRDADVRPASAERVLTDVEVALGAFGANGKIPVTVKATARLHALSIADNFPSTMPANVKLDMITADGLRDLYKSGAITEANLLKGQNTIADKFRTDLAAALDAEVSAKGTFERESMGGTPGSPHREDPPVVLALEATTDYVVEGATGDRAQVAFDAGAVVSFKLDLAAEARHSATYTLMAPEGILFADPGTDGVLGADKRSVAFTIDNAQGASKLSRAVVARMHSATATAYSAPDAKLTIEVDLKDLDVSVTKAAGGDFGQALVDVRVEGRFGVLALPEEFKQKLPAGVDLAYLSSDSIRVLLDKGIITQDEIKELEARLLSEMASRMSAMLGEEVQVTGGLDEASLASTLVAQPLSSDTPIVFKATTSLRKSLGGGGGGTQAQAAISLYKLPMSFAFPRVQDLETTYKLILPYGLSVADVTSPGSQTRTGVTEDGREYLLVEPQEDGAVTTFSVGVTPTFVATKFWYIVLPIVLLIVLAIAVPVGLSIRRKRRARGGE